jgi:Xaa-Pro dipeptidase
MDKYGLDALVAATPANVTYLSDFRALSHDILGSFVFVVFPRETGVEPAILLPTGEAADLLALKMTWIKDVRPYGTFYVTVPKRSLTGLEASLGTMLSSSVQGDAFSLLREVLEEKGLAKGKIGLDEKYFSFADYSKLMKQLEGIEVVPAYDIFREIRTVKNEEQISVMREANRITERGISAVLETARPGMSGVELVMAFSDTVAHLGALPLAPTVALGEDSFLQNIFVPSKHRLERGDLLRFDVACMYKHHYTDIGRNAVMGEPSTQQRKLYNVVFQGEDQALKLVRTGTKASSVFDMGVRAAREAGLPDFKRHHCGHGIGLELYEPPLIVPSNNATLEKGSVINIETPYYEIGAGGFMVEDTVVVTDSEPVFLTELSRDLIGVPV